MITFIKVFISLFILTSCAKKEESPLTDENLNSLSTNSILFNSELNGSFQIYTSNKNGENIQSLTNDPAYDYWWPRLSPDRTEILYYRAPIADNQNYGAAQLWLMNSDGSNKREIISQGENGWSIQAHAEWSPKGDRLVMCSGIGGVLHIVVTDANGQNQQQITSDGNWNCDPAWDRDGSRIIFNRCTSTNCGGAHNPDLDIYIMNADGSNMIQLTNDSLADYDPYFSPVRDEVAWLRLEDHTALGGVGRWGLHLMSDDGSNKSTIINDGWVNSKPGWSMDGSQIFFHRLDLTTNTKWQIFKINPDGTNLIKLPIHDGHNVEYPTNI